MAKDKPKRFIKGKLYKAVEPYAPEAPKFNHYKPANTGDFEICDCWVVDANGRIHPGYNVSPVPVHWSNLKRN
jgi:hypothetical protein